MGTSFTSRHGYGPNREITVREDAPEALRIGLIQIGRELGMSYSELREVVCRVLRRFPDQYNWSEVPNVRDEVVELVRGCDWFRVYDIAEAMYRHLAERGRGSEFTDSLNRLFAEEGIGWQIVDGEIRTRGEEEFEHAVANAVEQLEVADLQTARRELHEARQDLSRRPEPDITGTIQHCMAALEATARVLANDPRATLGDIIKRRSQDLDIPRPLDNALELIWGYASEMGRHLREGRNPNREEAELLLGTASSLITYLLQVNRRATR